MLFKFTLVFANMTGYLHSDFNIYVWLFLLMFIAHEAEEFFFMKKWGMNIKESNTQNSVSKMIISKLNNIDLFSFRLTIIEEIVIVTVLLIRIISKSNYNLFVGLFVTYSLHIILHLIQSMLAKRYLPLTLTSVLSLVYLIPASIYMINNVLYDSKTIIYVILTMIITYINLVVMQKIFKALKDSKK